MINATPSPSTHLVKVCGNCESEIGLQRLGPGQVPSHGVCKRHLLSSLGRAISAHDIQRIEAAPEDTFCPDLAKHPELVDTTNHWRPERGVFKHNLTTINDEHGGMLTKV